MVNTLIIIRGVFMKFLKRVVICGALMCSLVNFSMFSNSDVFAASYSSGVGLSAHCIKAYNENWQYSYGSATEGYVDCSGLIWSYNGVGGVRTDMLAASSEWGYVSNGIPRIHGLGLHQPGHVGVYIGSNQAIDARDYGINCVLHNPYQKSWVEWFKIAGVSYPNTGWVLLNGQAFYYENGQYIVDTQRTFDNITYTFDSWGRSDILPPDNVYTETDYSNVRVTEPQVDYAAIEAQRAEAERKAAEEAERKAAEEKARIEAERKAAEEKARIEAEKKAAEEKAKAEAAKRAEEERQRQKQIEEQRQEALKKVKERRIKREISRRRSNVNKKKVDNRELKVAETVDKTSSLSVNIDNFSSCNILIAKNVTLNNSIKVNNIENVEDGSNKIDVSLCSHFVAGDSEAKRKAKTEYMDVMYSDSFDFNNDVMAYSDKEDDKIEESGPTKSSGQKKEG